MVTLRNKESIMPFFSWKKVLVLGLYKGFNDEYLLKNHGAFLDEDRSAHRNVD